MDVTKEAIISALEPYIGMEQGDLIKSFNLFGGKKPKNANKVIVYEILKKAGLEIKGSNLKDNGLLLKNCAITPKGLLQDPLPFRSFSFEDVCHTPFEESPILDDWSKTIVLIVWKKESRDRGGKQKLYSVRDMRIKNSVLFGECKRVYEALQERLKTGQVYKLQKGIVKSNLPSAVESPVCHVRPKALKGSDTEKLPTPDKLTGAITMTKQCFWLNREFIKQFI